MSDRDWGGLGICWDLALPQHGHSNKEEKSKENRDCSRKSIPTKHLPAATGPGMPRDQPRDQPCPQMPPGEGPAGMCPQASLKSPPWAPKAILQQTLLPPQLGAGIGVIPKLCPMNQEQWDHPQTSQHFHPLLPALGGAAQSPWGAPAAP